ncbi:MAG: hypothetical protein CVU91_09635 [Firmicutes bacterium HGW-Firmicutes-16]|nr:MAG: hypothetical protein CVU91_09635 [Firmicutes bacterium HGW-Firmicutes-16]
MNHEEKALTYFSNNFNCAQAVFASFAPDFGIDEELALKLATELGGGARCGQLCGAVSGALMVLGLKYGNSHSGDKEEISKAISVAVEFNKRFCERNNSVVCKELLGYDLSIPEQNKKIREKNLFTSICPKMVEDATEIVEQLLTETDNQ